MMRNSICRTLTLIVILCGTTCLAAADGERKRVLIVMDEREQMEALCRYLAKAEIACTIADQANLPEDWAPYHSVIGYIHGKLAEPTELKFISYTRDGGRLILLHHTISGGKSVNKYFFKFLGIELSDPEKSREPSIPGGHYAWRDPIVQTIVNLQPEHYVTNHGVSWPRKTLYRSSDEPSVPCELPSLVLAESEAYVNHKFSDGRAKTVLLGFQWTDDRNGQSYMQDRTAWYKPQGKGWIFYFQPGHSTREFENPVIAQLILNAIMWDMSPARKR